jgi:hypothetical protein
MPLYEFQPSFTVDQTDLSLTSTGSGVHLNKAVTVDLGILDRVSGTVGSNRDFLSNAYVNNINVDILNIDGTVKYQDFLTDYKSNAFTITEYDNINTFGRYTKDFGVRATVSDSTQTHTSEFYLYGNALEFSGITIRDSTGTTSHTGSQSSKTAVNATGQTGILTSTITFNNDKLYTSFDKVDIYSSTGSDEFVNQIGLTPVFSRSLNNAPIQSFNITEGILPPDTGIYLHFVPYSQVGQGEAWTVGPYTFKNNPIASNPYITEVTSGDITGALGFTPSDSSSSGGVRTVTAGGNTLDSSETLAFTAGSNIQITESSGEVTIASPSGVASDDVNFIVKLTQAEYDAITPDSNTLYFISDESTNSPVVNPIKTVTSNYTITDTDHTVLVNGSASTDITLPSAVNNSNYVYNIKNLTTEAVNISSTVGLIDLSSSETINSRFQSLTVQSDGSNWYII